MSCPSGAITRFPLQLSATITDLLYDGVSEPITMDIQWAARSTPPMFIDPKIESKTDEVGAGNTNLTTLRFNNNNYTVSSVQFIKASHTPWILPLSSQPLNKEDIVITFSTNNTTLQYAHITFVIPILRDGTSTNPTYLNGLSDPNTNGPFSLQSCFPSNSRARFAFYAICLAGYSLSSPSQNAYVFVSTDGIRVSSELMTKILGIRGGIDFGSFSPSYLNRLSGTSTIVGYTDFSKYVMSTTNLLNYNDFKRLYPQIETDVRQDDTSAYQCVAIDPDSAIVDGKLSVDIKSGEVLTDVLEKRDQLRAENNVTVSMDPGRLERYMGTALGIILSILLFGMIFHFAMIIFLEAGVSDEINNYWTLYIPRYGIMLLITGFIGFVIGAMLN
jgi:hypothetical protein